MAIGTYSLTILDDVKNFIGMSGSVSEDDDLLEDLINRVSSMFELYMNRNILSREYTEDHNGEGASKLFPKQPKITTVSGIWDSYDWNYTDDYLIDADDYKVVDENHIVLKNTTFNDYIQNIRIIYTAGYTTTPLDLAQSCIEEVSLAYTNKNQIGVLSKTLSDGSISFVAGDLLPKTKLVLNKYKRISIV